MKFLLGETRRADEKWHMIGEGERVAAGLSGGKDSLVLLRVLAAYRRIKPFELTAITVKPSREWDTAPLEEMCRALEVTYVTVEGELLNTVMREKNPCALCARLRRGMLVRACAERGIGVLALGHHREDLAETVLMNLLEGGRAAALAPVLKEGRENVRVIRPLLGVPEEKLRAAAERLELPVLRNPCPADGHTARRKAREALETLEKMYPGAAGRILHAAEKDLFPPAGQAIPNDNDVTDR